MDKNSQLPPFIGLFDAPDTLGWNTPQHSQPLYYLPMVARHYSYRQIGQRKTRPDTIEVVNIRVEVLPVCAGDWPHRKHEFAFVETASASVSRVRNANFVEHYVDGSLASRSGYGHSSMSLYEDVCCYEKVHEKQRGSTAIDCRGYAAADMLMRDSFCCGFPLVKEREFTDYSTLLVAHCSNCCRQWEVVDGLHFRSRGSHVSGNSQP